MKQLHIVTVGLSLLNTFARAKGLKPTPAARKSADLWAFLNENPRTHSAEINALDACLGLLSKKQAGLGVTLVYTQTVEGKLMAALLGKFLRQRGAQVAEIKLQGIDLPAAQDADRRVTQQMAEAGLRRLRDKVHDHVTRMRRQHPDLPVKFNVTGGYKAEVAVLYELGRFLRLPVYYLHESYKTAILLP